MRIGENLRMIRQRNRLSQEYVSGQLGMTQSNYSKLEGNKFFPSGTVLEKLATLYNIREEELLISQESDDGKAIESITNSFRPANRNPTVQNLELTKDTIIALQAKQIELLEFQINTLRLSSQTPSASMVNNEPHESKY